MKITFAALSLPKTGALAVAVAWDRKLSPSAKQLDKASGGALGRAMEVSRFRGKKGEILERDRFTSSGVMGPLIITKENINLVIPILKELHYLNLFWDLVLT